MKKKRLQKENWMSAEILCPFYMGIEEGRTMQCESWEKMEDKHYVQVKTGSMEELKKYVKKYCGGDYQSCGVYRMILQEKYKDF